MMHILAAHFFNIDQSPILGQSLIYQFGWLAVKRISFEDAHFLYKLKIGISDAGTPQPDRDLNVETLLVKV